MREKKEIDRLFQERFKNFEAEPSPEVWSGIQNRLDKRKSRKVIPLWWKLSGVAAVLVLFFILGELFFIDRQAGINDPGNPTVTTSDTVPEEGNSNQTIELNAPGADDNALAEQDSNSTGSENEQKQDRSNVNEGLKKRNDKNAGIAEVENSRSDHNGSPSSTENQLATSKTSKEQEQSTTASQDDDNAEALAITEKPTEIENNQQKQDRSTGNPVVQTDSDTEEPAAASLLDFVTNPDDEQETELADNNKKPKRWALTPNIAPVYYNSFSGSGIDPQFADNDKEGGVNMSYGLLVSYEVSDKVTIRSGVNRIGLNYNTNNVAITTSLQAGALSSVNYSSGSQILAVSSNPKTSAEQDVNNSPAVLDIPQRNSISIGSFNQSLAYYEIPMEVEYALIEQKIGLHLIGGLSTLVLDNNEINLSQNNFTTFFGTSNSLNNISFSTNIGLGINYKFTDAIKFNLEPIFKYQLNAYKNELRNFSPYYLGLYSGLSIKF